MNNKFLDKLIRNKEEELQELRKVEAYLEEVERLNRVKVMLNVSSSIATMYYKDTQVTITGDEKSIANTVIDFFQQATNGVDIYISNYGEPGTIGTMVGNIISLDKTFTVHKMREAVLQS